MKRIYCDICGKELILTPITVRDLKESDYTVYRNDKYGKHLLDLCDKCSINLSKLIKDLGGEENERKTESKEI